jgi:hypothetical protein
MKGCTFMLANKPQIATLLVALGIGTIGFGLAGFAPAAGQDDADTAAMIENAMSAAPRSVSGDATILDYAMDDAGKFVVLREGSNGWFCQPDNPASPGPDPWCFDQSWLDWLYAFVAGEEPKTAVPGITYMLQGGSDPSNTDPMLTEPAEGEDWVNSGPHIMVLMPDALDQTAFSTDHDSGYPYIMWAGTPYEHIMIPVTDHHE